MLKQLIEAKKSCFPDYKYTYEDLCKMDNKSRRNFIIHLYASVFGKGEQERELVEYGFLSPDFSDKFYHFYKSFLNNEER